MANVLKSGKWSHDYPRCVNCGTSEIPHKAEGLCNRCYLWAYKQARRMGYMTVRAKTGAIKRVRRTGKKKRRDAGRPRGREEG